MNAAAWTDANDRYLCASLAWLKLRLECLCAGVVERPAETTEVERWPRLRLRSNGVATPGKALPDSRLAAAAAERKAAAEVSPPPALELLAVRLGLSEFERDTLLLCTAPDLDPAIANLLGTLQPASARGAPTFQLAQRVLDEPSWDALSPLRPLRYARLIEINQPGTTSLVTSALRADERVLNYLRGLNVLDERLSSVLTPSAARVSDLARSQLAIADDLFADLAASNAGSRSAVVNLVGADRGSKLAIAEKICASFDRQLFCLSLDALPTARADIDSLARLWRRETLLMRVALFVDAEELDSASADGVAALHAFTGHDGGLILVGIREMPARRDPGARIVEVSRPTPLEQCDFWSQLLAEAGDDAARADAQHLAGQFNLNFEEIRHAAATAVQSVTKDALVVRAWNACRRLVQPRLDALAQRIEPLATWDELVLSAESTHLLRQVVGQVRQRYKVYEDWGYARKLTRGLGINALFAGESGTGKTMAAEVLANELNLALYRIDLSAVVSKYIGETEKNLRRLFDAAERGGAILLFDEADALFGKRSEVKDSHDRYANIEVNYLLQRMESFTGLAILATNMKSALDAAFLRRLRFIVTFQFPGPTERKQIWQKALPDEVPREAIDFERLARFNVSGGNIHSIVLNAAFSAAQRGTPVTLPLLLSATRGELRKLDKPINEGEFRFESGARS